MKGKVGWDHGEWNIEMMSGMVEERKERCMSETKMAYMC